MPDDVTEENPLEFFTDEELFRELAKRCTHAVFIFEKDISDSQCKTNFMYWGGVIGAIGLCRFAESGLIDGFHNDGTDDID